MLYQIAIQKEEEDEEARAKRDNGACIVSPLILAFIRAGESEAKVRQLFQEASALAPCIIFIGLFRLTHWHTVLNACRRHELLLQHLHQSIISPICGC